MDIQTYKQTLSWENGQKLMPELVLDKEEVHTKGLLHLSTHLLVRNKLGEILCRKRADGDFRYAGLWTTTIGTHVPINQWFEEILIEYFPVKKPLQWIGEFRVHDEFENEVNGLYTVQLENEVMGDEFTKDRKFISVSELEELIKQGKTTPHLSGAFELLQSKEL